MKAKQLQKVANSIAGGHAFELLQTDGLPNKCKARKEGKIFHGSCVRHGLMRPINFAARAKGEKFRCLVGEREEDS